MLQRNHCHLRRSLLNLRRSSNNCQHRFTPLLTLLSQQQQEQKRFQHAASSHQMKKNDENHQSQQQQHKKNVVYNMDPMFIVQSGLNHALHFEISPTHDFSDQLLLTKSQYSKDKGAQNTNVQGSLKMGVPLDKLVPGSIATLADTTIGIGAITHLPSEANRMALVELDISYLSYLEDGDENSEVVNTRSHDYSYYV